eukprot:CAMPEP_0173176720 /NCGR_PEP_ID=MMETSP1141-20130122/4616_1 /TAXON_ID=483371 /ORGANISM="non described non described, Strain CCMP2298" /LENGTH=343 /DNA_ID=CAMNT_0014099089 /DNA_START=2979 /DNA_END=4010 /DNA_ORIENTATION=-
MAATLCLSILLRDNTSSSLSNARRFPGPCIFSSRSLPLRLARCWSIREATAGSADSSLPPPPPSPPPSCACCFFSCWFWNSLCMDIFSASFLACLPVWNLRFCSPPPVMSLAMLESPGVRIHSSLLFSSTPISAFCASSYLRGPSLTANARSNDGSNCAPAKPSGCAALPACMNIAARWSGRCGPASQSSSLSSSSGGGACFIACRAARMSATLGMLGPCTGGGEGEGEDCRAPGHSGPATAATAPTAPTEGPCSLRCGASRGPCAALADPAVSVDLDPRPNASTCACAFACALACACSSASACAFAFSALCSSCSNTAPVCSSTPHTLSRFHPWGREYPSGE